MKITYSKPGTIQWIHISKIEDRGEVYTKVPLDEPLPVGTVVFTLFSSGGEHVGLRREVIRPWDPISGPRSAVPTYENIGNVLASRDTMFRRVRGTKHTPKPQKTIFKTEVSL